jgi:hypothetical protein
MRLVFGEDVPCRRCRGKGCDYCTGEGYISPREGERRKQEGQVRVLRDVPYGARFERAVMDRERGVEYVSEDITAEVGMPPGHPNQVGALMTACAKKGLHRGTGRFVKARRQNQNGSKIEVWVRL